MPRTFKTLIIATAILSLFLTFLTPSEAIEITQMYPSYGGYEDHTGYLYHTAYVETDSPYLFVYWYIDGVQQSISGGPSTSAYFSPNSSSVPGSSDGTTYTIEAVAYQYDPEDDVILSDSSSYAVTVYTACLETAASLTASITSCGWSGSTSSATAKATLNHTGGDDAPDVDYMFKFTYKVVRLQKNGAVKGNVYIPQVITSQGQASPGDAKITNNYSDSYTLSNGWPKGETFKVETEVVVWAQNADRNADPEECTDRASDTYTIPDN